MADTSKAVVPMNFIDHDFFEQQRMFFNEISDHYNNDISKFDNQLDTIKNSMHEFDDGRSHLSLEHPFVEDIYGNKKFKINFNCRGFKPSDIEVITKDNSLAVHAKHEEMSPGRTIKREFTKTCTLPSNVDPLKLRSSLSKDGVLAVEAPVSKEVDARKELLVPIEIIKEKL